MILVKAAPGLVIEMAWDGAGKFGRLSLRLAEGLASRPFLFEVEASANGRLAVRSLEARELGELTAALGALFANEEKVLAEVVKYGGR